MTIPAALPYAPNGGSITGLYRAALASLQMSRRLRRAPMAH